MCGEEGEGKEDTYIVMMLSAMERGGPMVASIKQKLLWGIMRGLGDEGQKAPSWACFVCVACLLGFFLTAIIWITPWGAHGDCGGCGIISGFGGLWVIDVLFGVSVGSLFFLLSNPLDRWMGFCS